MAEERRRRKSGSRLSVRVRLLAIALLPTLVVLPLFLGWAMVRWNAKFDSLLITKVNGDLTIAHQYFSRILENSGEKIDALGQSASFRDVADSGDAALLAGLLERRREATRAIDRTLAESAAEQHKQLPLQPSAGMESHRKP